MSDSPLDFDLKFLPAWLKETPAPNRYADFAGEEPRRERDDRRGPGRGAPGRGPRPPGGERDRGPRRDDRGGARPRGPVAAVESRADSAARAGSVTIVAAVIFATSVRPSRRHRACLW